MHVFATDLRLQYSQHRFCGYNTHNYVTHNINEIGAPPTRRVSRPNKTIMSESFLQACEARAADVDLWKGATTTTRLPYLAFATKDVQGAL